MPQSYDALGKAKLSAVKGKPFSVQQLVFMGIGPVSEYDNRGSKKSLVVLTMASSLDVRLIEVKALRHDSKHKAANCMHQASDVLGSFDW